MKKLYFDPNEYYVSSPGRTELLEDFRRDYGEDVYKMWRDLKIGDVFKELVPGIYEYWDVNKPMFLERTYHLVNCEYLPTKRNLGKLSSLLGISTGFIKRLGKNEKGKVWISYPYGVCDNYQQILERDKRIKALEKWKGFEFVIIISEIRKKDEPPRDGWRWEKWGSYIGDQNTMTDYLYDEPEIENVYVYSTYRVQER